MTPIDSADSRLDALGTAESYPTFWDAIPVDRPGSTPPPALPDADAYAAFLDFDEGGSTATLNVEESDVGLN
jgi:hypothetical protein